MAAKKKSVPPMRPAEGGNNQSDTTDPTKRWEEISSGITQEPTSDQGLRFSPPPPRWAIIQTRNDRGEVVTQRAYGRHQGVVDSSGRLLPYYDPYADGDRIFYQQNPQKLNQLVMDLQSVGFNVGSQPQLISALTELIKQSNAVGYTWDVTLQMMKDNLPFKVSRGGGGVRVSNIDDLKAIGRQVARQVIGREFTAEESNAFALAYQGLQRSQGAGAPSADVYAEKFAQEKAPEEATAYKYLDYVNQLIAAVGGANV